MISEKGKIFTVTLNPSLDYSVTVDHFRLGYTNRTVSEYMCVGGKGINVSMVFRNMGYDSTALGFVAGFTGQEAVRQLAEREIGNGLIRLEKGLTRINFKLQSVEGTEVNGQGPEIPEEKLEQLMGRLSELAAGDVLFLSGSIPSALPEDTYLRMMERLAEGVLTVVDVSGEGLVKADVHHIKSHISGTGHSHKRIKIGSVVVEQCSCIMYKTGYLGDVTLKDSKCVGIGHHDGGHSFVKQRSEVIDIHRSVGTALYLNNLQSCHSGTCRVGSMSRVRHYYLYALCITAALMIGSDYHQSCKLAMSSGIGIKRELLHAAYL